MKNVLKLIATLSILISVTPSFSQDKGDLGFIISTYNIEKIALEYRTAEKGQYRIRAGYSYGVRAFWNDRNNPRTIITASDSMIVYRYSTQYQLNHSVRFGLQRQFGESIFSAVADLTLGYKIKTLYSYDSPLVLTESGWYQGYFYPEGEEPSNVQNNGSLNLARSVPGENNLYHTREHFLLPGIRLGVNMDLPIKKAFVLHTGVYSSFAMPIYMGRSDFIDDTQTHFGTPPSVFQLDFNAEIGLRYNIGSFKNRKRKVKA